MKTHSLIPALLLCLGALVAAPPNAARAETEISFQFFYDSLTPHGEWVTVGEYGTAWHPSNVDNDWSPYQEGSWAYTDAGWTWVSEEPWGDVVYHYGRWVQVNDYGWCWVPGYEWAPAWVSWRSSDNYVGWAPLPPEAEWRPSVGISVWSDSYYDIGPSNYRFCHVRDFCEPNVRTYCRPRSENYNLMGLTINITNINYNNDDRRIFCGGPNMDYLYGRTNRPVRHLRLVEEDRYQRSSVRGDEYRYSRLPVSNDRYRGRDQVQNQIVRKLSNDRVDRGWHNGGRNNDKQHRDLRGRVQDQVRGLTPENRPARVIAKTAGGVSRDDLPGRFDRSKGKDQDNDRSRMPEKPKGPVVDPRVGNRDDSKKKDDKDEVRRAMPLNPRDEPPGRGRPDSSSDKKDRDDKPKGNDPRQPMRADPVRPDTRPGFPTPPRDNRDRDDSKSKGRDEGGNSRAPMTPNKIAPNENPSRRDSSPDRVTPKPPQPQKKVETTPPSPRRDNSPDRVVPQAPKPSKPASNPPTQRREDSRDRVAPPMVKPPQPQKKAETRPPAPRRESAPERVAPKVNKPAPPKKRVESAPRPKQPQQAPKVVRPPSKPAAPKVERRSPPPSAPKPQAAPNKRPATSDKKKEDEKKNKR